MFWWASSGVCSKYRFVYELPWSQRFFLIFLRMGELRESREALNKSREDCCSPLRAKKKNKENPLGPGYLCLYKLWHPDMYFFFKEFSRALVSWYLLGQWTESISFCVSIQQRGNVVNKSFPSRWYHKPDFFKRALPYNRKGICGIYAQVSRQVPWQEHYYMTSPNNVNIRVCMGM